MAESWSDGDQTALRVNRFPWKTYSEGTKAGTRVQLAQAVGGPRHGACRQTHRPKTQRVI
jgi:hypothetical protein